MSDRIDLGGRPWKAIPREILRDKRLSPQAKGGLVTLLSHDAGWVRSVIAILMKENRRCGRKQAQAIMRELCSAGYAELTQSRRTDGTFSTGYTVGVESRSDPGTSLSPCAVGRDTVSRDAVDRSAVVEPQDVEPPEVEPETNSFAEFYRIYPRHEKPRAAEKAFLSALRRATPKQIIEGAERFAGDPNLPQKTLIPHPSTWLNADGWLSDPLPPRLNGHRESREERLARLAEGM